MWNPNPMQLKASGIRRAFSQKRSIDDPFFPINGKCWSLKMTVTAGTTLKNRKWWMGGKRKIYPRMKHRGYRNEKGQFHRTDGPAIEWTDGYKAWFMEGSLHREGGPAVIWPDGSECWYRNNLLHRIGGPAVTNRDGSKEYWIDGVRQETPVSEITEGTWLDTALGNLPDGPIVWTHFPRKGSTGIVNGTIVANIRKYSIGKNGSWIATLTGFLWYDRENPLNRIPGGSNTISTKGFGSRKVAVQAIEKAWINRPRTKKEE